MTINIQTDAPKEAQKASKSQEKRENIHTKKVDVPITEELISRSEVDKIVAQEVAKLETQLRAEAIKKLKKEDDTVAIKHYLDKTRVTDKKFILKLIKWQVNVAVAGELENKDSELTREKLWEYLRKNHKPKK